MKRGEPVPRLGGGKAGRLGLGERKSSVAFSAVAPPMFLTWEDFLRYFSNWICRAVGQISAALTGEECEKERQTYLTSVLWQEKQGPLGTGSMHN